MVFVLSFFEKTTAKNEADIKLLCPCCSCLLLQPQSWVSRYRCCLQKCRREHVPVYGAGAAAFPHKTPHPACICVPVWNAAFCGVDRAEIVRQRLGQRPSDPGVLVLYHQIALQARACWLSSCSAGIPLTGALLDIWLHPAAHRPVGKNV